MAIYGTTFFGDKLLADSWSWIILHFNPPLTHSITNEVSLKIWRFCDDQFRSWWIVMEVSRGQDVWKPSTIGQRRFGDDQFRGWWILESFTKARCMKAVNDRATKIWRWPIPRLMDSFAHIVPLVGSCISVASATWTSMTPTNPNYYFVQPDIQCMIHLANRILRISKCFEFSPQSWAPNAVCEAIFSWLCSVIP